MAAERGFMPRVSKKKDASSDSIMDRRRFLKLSGAFVAATAFGKAGEALANPEEDIEKMEAEYLELYHEMHEFVPRGEKNCRGMCFLSLEETEQARNSFKEKFYPEKIQRLVVLVKALKKTNTSFGIPFVWTDCTGLLVSELEEQDVYQHQEILEAWIGKYYYFSRASDYLPTGEMISAREIDPRFSLVDNHEFGEDVQAQIAEYPGWASEEKQELFRFVLNIPEVRLLFQESDCNLAEVYSIVKLTSKDELERYQKGNVRAVQRRIVRNIEDALYEREISKNELILGPETDTLISLSYFESGYRQMDPRRLRGLAEACGVKNHFEIDTSKGVAASKELSEQIQNSHGETTLYIDTHGSKDGFIGIAENEQGFHVSEIAYALINRMLKTRDPHELEKITVIFESCFSEDIYDIFIEYLQRGIDYIEGPRGAADYAGIDELRRGVKRFCNVIVSAQRGSTGYTTTSLQEFIPAIRRNGKYTMGFAMQKIQAMEYPRVDYGFYLGGGKREQKVGAFYRQNQEQVSV